MSEKSSVAYVDRVIGNRRDAIPIVFCHAFTSSKDMLKNTLVKEFSEEALKQGMDVRIIVFDFPGHGDSGKLSRYSLDILEESLTSFLDSIGVEEYHLFGMSMGSVVAFMHAARKPERVRSLSIQGMPITGEDIPAFLKAIHHSLLVPRTFMRSLNFGNFFGAEHLDQFKKVFPMMFNWYVSTWFADVYDVQKNSFAARQLARDFVRVDSNVLYDMVPEFVALNLEEEFKRFKNELLNYMPVLIIDGAYHDHPYLDTFDRLKELLGGPYTKELLVQGAGHCASVLKPGLVASALLEHIQDTEKLAFVFPREA